MREQKETKKKAVEGVNLNDLLSDKEQLEWLWSNCRIVYWPKIADGVVAYPKEHNSSANKDGRNFIEVYMRKG